MSCAVGHIDRYIRTLRVPQDNQNIKEICGETSYDETPTDGEAQDPDSGPEPLDSPVDSEGAPNERATGISTTDEERATSYESSDEETPLPNALAEGYISPASSFRESRWSKRYRFALIGDPHVRR